VAGQLLKYLFDKKRKPGHYPGFLISSITIIIIEMKFSMFDIELLLEELIIDPISLPGIQFMKV